MAESFSTPLAARYFEDYYEGAVLECGPVTVEEEEVIAFARRYDPQVFHVDPAAAKKSIFGGLIASGWHTVAMVMRLLVDNYISHSASLSSPGVDELRWLAPVRPGDALFVKARVMEARASRSKPDRGIVRTQIEVFNQDDTLVMSLLATNLLGRRPTTE
ncbi:MAG: MaoC family dehydratase [Arenicellales bacterium]|jgi:acyl dehydratase|nr:MaoC family dehydratase [Arenicellales bacterium]HCV21250.1 acyl dehydratase [Gammaproteobacteria bacterium]MDP6314311.1 MaoC family dehydratase [Arenicellales bacterium]MDP7118679.1 MaoC family dehydratase [Arenicellales bacterium]MDP7193644.1 MaoC family dehydratase [Arenicellales bacterium]|tara:strand:+ start:222 stop:701 length:480 start_codon:yes stop_codon:yes gene_type:complete